MSRFRLRNRDTLLLDVEGRTLVLDGEMLVDGHWIERPASWTWLDGGRPKTSELPALIEIVRATATREGFKLLIGDDDPDGTMAEQERRLSTGRFAVLPGGRLRLELDGVTYERAGQVDGDAVEMWLEDRWMAVDGTADRPSPDLEMDGIQVAFRAGFRTVETRRR